jgi:hypothetical protein
LAQMDAVMSNFRFVAGGYEIRNLIPPTTATGRVIVAKVPVSGYFPGPNALASNSFLNWNIANGAVQVSSISNSYSTGFPSGILSLPWAEEFTMQDIISDTIRVSHRICSATAYDFHQTGSNAAENATVDLAGGLAVTGSSGVPVTGIDSLTDETAIGWDAVLIRFEGLPASTTGVAEIKYIQHYEGSPSVSASTSGTILAPSSSTEPHVDPIGLLNVTQKLSVEPSISLVSKIVGAAGSWLGRQITTKGPDLMSAILSRMGLQL